MPDTKEELGEITRLEITCISERGWDDHQTLLGDIEDAGGLSSADQYEIPWPPFGELNAANARGACALLRAEGPDGARHACLLDAGWGPRWIEERLEATGAGEMLRAGEIELLVISHDHFDHLWGIGSVLQHAPAIPIYVPRGISERGRALIRDSGHRGDVVTVGPDRPVPLFPGASVVSRPIPSARQLLGAVDENSLYFNLQGRGMVVVTGCGHPGIDALIDYAGQHLAGGGRIHAVYGGLHITPFDTPRDREPESRARRAALLRRLEGYGVAEWCCNHCTGRIAIDEMKEAGLDVREIRDGESVTWSA
jgi:7,8-dihydropterin-6-yl-methyl-4-(beta-D-ribofuranosyl)aminobenzene 5'-phosphate synthase